MASPADHDTLATARRVIEAESRAVRATLGSLGEAFVRAAQILAGCTGKVLVTGSGTSGAVAIRAAHLLSVGGTPAFHLSPADGLHGGLGALRAGDVVVALSKGGESAELNAFCLRARALCGTLVAITAAPDSSLARLADPVIVLTLDEDADIGNVVATGSSLAAAAVLDALMEVTRMSRGYSWKDLLYTHPAGAVGRDAAASLARLDRGASGDGRPGGGG